MARNFWPYPISPATARQPVLPSPPPIKSNVGIKTLCHIRNQLHAAARRYIQGRSHVRRENDERSDAVFLPTEFRHSIHGRLLEYRQRKRQLWPLSLDNATNVGQQDGGGTPRPLFDGAIGTTTVITTTGTHSRAPIPILVLSSLKAPRAVAARKIKEPRFTPAQQRKTKALPLLTP